MSLVFLVFQSTPVLNTHNLLAIAVYSRIKSRVYLVIDNDIVLAVQVIKFQGDEFLKEGFYTTHVVKVYTVENIHVR